MVGHISHGTEAELCVTGSYEKVEKYMVGVGHGSIGYSKITWGVEVERIAQRCFHGECELRQSCQEHGFGRTAYCSITNLLGLFPRALLIACFATRVRC